MTWTWHRLRLLNELGTVEMLRDARSDRLEQARLEAGQAGAVGLAAGIGANIAALMAMTGRYAETMALASEVELTAGRLGLVPLRAAALLMQGFAMAHQGRLLKTTGQAAPRRRTADAGLPARLLSAGVTAREARANG